MTVAIVLRGLSNSQILEIYYNYPRIPSHDEWVRQVKELSKGEYTQFVKELQTITERYMSKCDITNYTRLKCALTDYLYKKFIVPKQNFDWNPKSLLAVEIIETDVKAVPIIENYWDMKYNNS